MSVILVQAARDDMEELWKMQVEAFSDLLKKYQDYDVSPAAESFEKVMARFEQPWTTYYFITADGKKVGAADLDWHSHPLLPFRRKCGSRIWRRNCISIMNTTSGCVSCHRPKTGIMSSVSI